MKKVLDVGNCDPDHAAISAFFLGNFDDVKMGRAKLPADTMSQLKSEDWDLVVINRKLDEDYTDGLEIIKQMKADPATAEVPVMLVSNMPEHQEQAVAAGALRGFGKLEYADPKAVQRVKEVLG